MKNLNGSNNTIVLILSVLGVVLVGSVIISSVPIKSDATTSLDTCGFNDSRFTIYNQKCIMSIDDQKLDIIIKNQETIIKNQETIKCQNLYKDSFDYSGDEFFDKDLVSKPSKLREKCGA